MTKKIKIDLSTGKCEEVLKDFPDNHFDSVITDPPYGLGDEPDPVELLKAWLHETEVKTGSGGFMGRKWDAIVPSPTQFREVLRVVKPGSQFAFFAGTRTLHLMMSSLRFAGFEIQEVLAWCYGCYSDDTEILTPDGWQPGVDISEGDMVAAWDPKTEEIRFVPVEKKILAPYKGEMIRFKNDNTDQLLTPNHRVYAKHRTRKMVDGVRKAFFNQEWVVKEAGEINRWNYLDLPLSGYHDGCGIGGSDFAALLGWVWTEGGYDNVGSGVRIYQSSTNQHHVDAIRDLLVRMGLDYKEYSREREYRSRPYTEYIWLMSGDTALQIREILPDKSPSWGLLWQMTQEEKMAFFDAAMCGDGCTAGGSFEFYQKSLADLEKMQTLAHLIGLQGRINEKAVCVSLHDNPKTQLQGRHLKANHKQPYDGNVWCVAVETGAVMVRRKGRVFISGNSGFPKNHNVYKALGKKVKARYEDSRCRCVGEEYVYDKDDFAPEGVLDIEQEARRVLILDDYGDHDLVTRVCSWCGQPDQGFIDSTEGLGTALKPAWEPIIVARKPESPVEVDVEGILSSYGFTEEEIRDILAPLS